MKNKKSLRIISALMLGLILTSSGCTGTGDDSSKTSSAPESSVSSTVSESSAKESSETIESKTETSSKEEQSQSSQESSTEVSQISQTSESSKPKSNITPAVWEVTDENGNIIYMMGSIHAADADALVLPDYFETAYAKCDALAVECDITDSLSSLTNISALKNMLYTDGTTIKDHVPEEEYNNAVKLLTDAGVYTSLYDVYKPVMWTSLAEQAAITRAGLSYSYGVDTNLINRAKEEKKEVLEVESVEFQFNLLSSLSDELQALLFSEIAQEDYLDKAADSLNRLYVKWKTGAVTVDDIEEDYSGLTPEQLKLVEEYDNSLKNNRNAGMVLKAQEYLESGKKVMFVVGAAHFYGEKGILQLMQNNGCTLRQLTAEDAEPLESSTQVSQQPSEELTEPESSVKETDPAALRAA